MRQTLRIYNMTILEDFKNVWFVLKLIGEFYIFL